MIFMPWFINSALPFDSSIRELLNRSASIAILNTFFSIRILSGLFSKMFESKILRIEFLRVRLTSLTI